MYLICKDNPKFLESGRMIRAAKELDIDVVDSVQNRLFEPFSSFGVEFCFGTIDFWMKNHTGWDIFSRQEYLYDFSFLLSVEQKILEFVLYNADAEIIPASRICSSFNYRTQKSVFIRPNSGYKQFAGTTISKFEVNTGNICYRFNINPWELIICAEDKGPPKEEYRFFCIKDEKTDEVHIKGCQYLPLESNLIPSFVLDYAKIAARKIFEHISFGTSFVLDLTYDYEEDEKSIYDETCSVLELNSWGCSSFYCIEPRELLNNIRKCNGFWL